MSGNTIGRDAFNQVAREIHNHFTDPSGSVATKGQAGPASAVPTPSLTFVPRKNITKKIHAALQGNPEQVVVRQAVTRAMGGYGKTVAAILYAEEYKASYPGGRFFLHIESGDIVAALATLVTPLGLASKNDKNADAVQVSLTLKNGEPSLLILDNVASKAAWEQMLATGLVPRGSCRALITTRDDTVAERNDIAVGRLETEEAREVYRLFCTDRKTKASHAPALPPETIADAITAWVGGLAVAVAAVAAFMRLNPDISWEEHWMGDGKGMVGLRNLPDIELPDDQPEVAAQLGLEGRALEAHRRTLRVIDDAIKSLPPPERRAVEYAARFPADMVPADWLEMLLNADTSRPDPAPGSPPHPLKLTLVKKPRSKFTPARVVLDHLETLDILLFGSDGGKFLSLHRLWAKRLLVLSYMPKDAWSNLWLALAARVPNSSMLPTLAENLGSTSVPGSPIPWEWWPLRERHEFLVSNIQLDRGVSGKSCHSLLEAILAPGPVELGRITDRRGNAVANLAAGSSGTTATLYRSMTALLVRCDHLSLAAKCAERMCYYAQFSLGKRHPDLAGLLCVSACVKLSSGNVRGARRDIRRALDIEYSWKPTYTHPAREIRWMAALISAAMGDPQASINGLQLAMSQFRKYPDSEPAVHAAMCACVANIEMASSNHERGAEHYREAEAILVRHFGDNHPHVKSVRASMKAAGCTP